MRCDIINTSLKLKVGTYRCLEYEMLAHEDTLKMTTNDKIGCRTSQVTCNELYKMLAKTVDIDNG